MKLEKERIVVSDDSVPLKAESKILPSEVHYQLDNPFALFLYSISFLFTLVAYFTVCDVTSNSQLHCFATCYRD